MIKFEKTQGADGGFIVIGKLDGKVVVKQPFHWVKGHPGALMSSEDADEVLALLDAEYNGAER